MALTSYVSLAALAGGLVFVAFHFKNMPELGWHYGYFYGLALIVISAVVGSVPPLA